MSRIRHKDTQPELFVRSVIHRGGYRYKLHDASLPGKPDLVFKSRKKVIFVHGCYWHLHDCKYGRVVAKTNRSFWATKRQENAKRDRKNDRILKKQGWSVLIVWECWARRPEWVENKIADFLRA